MSILSAAAIITGATFLSGLMGLLRNRTLVTYFYTTPEMQQQFEAYWVSFRLPELVFQLLVIGALSAAFIPVFSKYERISKENAFKMASTLLNFILLAFSLVSVVIWIWAIDFTRLITGPAFSEAQIMLSANMTRIMLFAQFFFAISNFLSGMIQSSKRFLIPAISPIVYNLGIILGTVLFTPSVGIYGPVFGVVLGAFLHGALQLPLAMKLGFRYYPSFSLQVPGVREVLKLMGPRTLSLSVNQIQLFSTVFFVTHLPGNNLTIITLAQQLMTLPIRVFGAPIGQAALPFLSKESNDGDFDKFRSLVIQSLHQISFFAMPASVLLLIMRIPIVRLAYGSRDFPWTATLLTGRVVAIFTLSIAAQAMSHLLIRAFYALHNTKHPLVVSLLSTAMFLGLSGWFIFGMGWGIISIAVAITISSIFELIVLILLLNRTVPFITRKDVWYPQLKMLTASFLMAVFLWLPFRIFDEIIFDTSRTIELIGLTVSVSTIGMLTYILFAYLLEIKELSMVAKLFEFFGPWQKTLSRSIEVVETAGQTDESTI